MYVNKGFSVLALPRRSTGRNMGYVLDCYGACPETCSCSPEPHHTTTPSRSSTNGWMLPWRAENNVIIRIKRVSTQALLSCDATVYYYSLLVKEFLFSCSLHASELQIPCFNAKQFTILDANKNDDSDFKSFKCKRVRCIMYFI